jgi:tripartite-type tricarboxylate transporter receptor subunit TctC
MDKQRTLTRIRHSGFALLASLSAAPLGDAVAQSFPSNPIRIIVPNNAGAPPDVVSRIVATELADREGWKFIVENRPGALQTLGVGDVLKQPADGHALIAMSVPTLAAPALLPSAGLRLDRDLAPVIKASSGYNVLVVHPSVPAKSVAELIALLKAQPDKFNFGSGGFGTPAHLIGELFKLRAGVRAAHVPYPQGQQFLADLLSGTTQFSFMTTVRALEFVHAGRLRALAVTAPKRIAAIPDVPTIAEQGLPDLAVEDWVGFAAKSGAPANAIARLNEMFSKAIVTPKAREALAKVGAEPAGGTPAEFGALITSQLAHWHAVVKAAGITMQPQ